MSFCLSWGELGWSFPEVALGLLPNMEERLEGETGVASSLGVSFLSIKN